MPDYFFGGKGMDNETRESENAVSAAFRKPWMSIVWFVLVLLVLYYAGFPIQEKLGMVGLAVTELMILAMALIPIFISKQKISDVFPVKKPALRHIIGVVLLWIGAFLVVMVVNIISFSLFPEPMRQMNEVMGKTFSSVSVIATILIVSVMPAICEEALHRGYIQSAMRGIRRDWVVVLIMGVLFGVFHMHPLRFAGTALLGAVLSYIMIKTRNIIYPAFMHLIHNLVPVLIAFWLYGDGAEVSTTGDISSGQAGNLLVIGSVVLVSCVAPLLIAGGASLLRKKIRAEEDPEGKKEWNRKKLRVIIVAVFLSGVLFIGGMVMVFIGSLSGMTLQVSEQFSLTRASDPKEYAVEVKAEGKYLLQYDLETDKGLLVFEMFDESGERQTFFFADKVFGNKTLDLDAGTYTIRISVMDEDMKLFCAENDFEYSEENFADLTLPANENDPVQIRATMTMIMTV